MAVRSIKKPQKESPQPATSEPAAQHAETLDEDSRRKIAEAAYYRAQQRGFSPGYELEDWLAAEEQVKNGHRAGA
jgi:hypothetical protein